MNNTNLPACEKKDCSNISVYKIICEEDFSYGCKDHAVELAGPFYSKKNRKEAPRFERVDPSQISSRPTESVQKTPLVSQRVKDQAAVVDKNNVGTGKANLENVARALSDEEKLDKAGFPKADTFFAVGTPLAESGVEAFRRERQEFNKLEPVSSAMRKLQEKISEEDRNDILVPIKEVIALEDYKIKIPGHGDFYVANPHALASLLSFSPLKLNITKYLAKCPPNLRATNINYWLNATESDVVANLRVRKGHAGNEIFAAVSQHYTPLDVDKVAEIVAQESPDGARVEVVYDGFSARIQILFHTDIDPKNGVVGEVFKAGSMLKTDDTGGGSLSGRAVAWRALCLNFTNMMVSTEVGRRRHMGSVDALRSAVRQFLREAFDRVEPFTSNWKSAQKENVVETAHPIESGQKIYVSDLFNSVMGLFAGSIERELIPLKGRKDEQILGLMRAWEKEPGPSRTNFVNAITRYAHESPQKSPWDEDELQDAASDILFSKKPLPYLNPAKSLIKE